mmetsp:Transcript_41673/g.107873  ORF Transcript_41673/g.107873 Transcript_41673/m.107873 type:complete len:202 (+) Transcript_41673:200-805(+)
MEAPHRAWRTQHSPGYPSPRRRGTQPGCPWRHRRRASRSCRRPEGGRRTAAWRASPFPSPKSKATARHRRPTCRGRRSARPPTARGTSACSARCPGRLPGPVRPPSRLCRHLASRTWTLPCCLAPHTPSGNRQAAPPTGARSGRAKQALRSHISRSWCHPCRPAARVATATASCGSRVAGPRRSACPRAASGCHRGTLTSA